MNDDEEVLIVNGCPILRRHHGLSIEDFVKLEVRRVSNPTEIQEVLPLLGCVHPEKRRKKEMYFCFERSFPCWAVSTVKEEKREGNREMYFCFERFVPCLAVTTMKRWEKEDKWNILLLWKVLSLLGYVHPEREWEEEKKDLRLENIVLFALREEYTRQPIRSSYLDHRDETRYGYRARVHPSG